MPVADPVTMQTPFFSSMSSPLVESGQGPFDSAVKRRGFCRSSPLVESGQGPFDSAVKRRGFCRLGPRENPAAQQVDELRTLRGTLVVHLVAQLRIDHELLVLRAQRIEQYARSLRRCDCIRLAMHDQPGQRQLRGAT